MNSILSSQMPKFSITNEKNSAQKYPSDLKYSKIKINFTFYYILKDYMWKQKKSLF